MNSPHNDQAPSECPNDSFSFGSFPHMTFIPSSLDNVEDVENYKPGGLHPVHLGDRFGSFGRYFIMHKLGFGAFSTLWLVRDLHANRNVALKICQADHGTENNESMILQKLMASDFHEGRQYVRSLYDSFSIEGVNGTHLCLVMEIGGPTIAEVCGQNESRRLRADLARKLATQVTQAVAFLHSQNVAHADISTHNILFRIQGLCSWSTDELDERLPEPHIEDVHMMDNQAPSSSAPIYLVDSMKMQDIVDLELDGDIMLIDFGLSYYAEESAHKQPIRNLQHSPPELILEFEGFLKSDLWALGCTIFELRIGGPLFMGSMANEDYILREVVKLLGKLPDRWWNMWKNHEEWFHEDGELKTFESEEAITVEIPKTIRERIIVSRKMDGPNGGTLEKSTERVLEPQNSRICDTEVDDMTDVLERMMKYEAEDRISAIEVLEHQWFAKDYSSEPLVD
ncbi:kinase-like protein [Tothia fuscella]|uniref:Kinase-like protein n=1 Tax=Tothia fuscella TaxID=1048955 RepID=A0A9P4NGS0_9PEZI|nr:kinase-like protein [Tothia fuscella]